MVKKLVKDLVSGDFVYVVHKDPDTIIECSIDITFEDDITGRSPYGYFTKRFKGVIYSGKNKMSKRDYADFQVFRVGTAGIWNEMIAEANNITEKNIHEYWPNTPGSFPLDIWNEFYNSTHFTVYKGFEVFTNLEDAKEYIVTKKLESLRNDMLKLIKVKKYKSKD